MRTLTTIAEMRAQVTVWRARHGRIALVPTMGNLHDGHLALVRQAQQVAEQVVVSIFVNPLQFSPDEDFATYPRTIAEDSGKLAQISPDVLFVPSVQEMYPGSGVTSTWVEVPGLSDILCGAFRPGHFRGVATVVAKLFNIVQPHLALFGEKDYQQLQVIRRMVADLAIPVDILTVPTVRASDGLALSSRNAYLNPEEGQRATRLFRALCAAAARIRQGERDFARLEADAVQDLQEAGFKPDYFRVCRTDLTPPQQGDQEWVIVAAAWLGKARLIDNLSLSLKQGA